MPVAIGGFVPWQEQVLIHSIAVAGCLPFLYYSNFIESPLRLRKPSPQVQIPANGPHSVTQDVITQVKKSRRPTLATDATTRFGY